MAYDRTPGAAANGGAATGRTRSAAAPSLLPSPAVTATTNWPCGTGRPGRLDDAGDLARVGDRDDHGLEPPAAGEAGDPVPRRGEGVVGETGHAGQLRPGELGRAGREVRVAASGEENEAQRVVVRCAQGAAGVVLHLPGGLADQLAEASTCSRRAVSVMRAPSAGVTDGETAVRGGVRRSTRAASSVAQATGRTRGRSVLLDDQRRRRGGTPPARLEVAGVGEGGQQRAAVAVARPGGIGHRAARERRRCA